MSKWGWTYNGPSMDISQIRSLSLEYAKGNMQTPPVDGVLRSDKWVQNDALYMKHVRSRRWQKLRRLAIAAAGGVCQECHSHSRLQAHHLDYGKLGNETLADLRVLCWDCHRSADAKRCKEDIAAKEAKLRAAKPEDLRRSA